MEQLDLTETAVRARTLQQQRSRARLQGRGALTVEQARELAKSKAQKTEEKARAKVEREITQKKRAWRKKRRT